ncbi:MAG: hypothetical protein OSA23_07700 [Rhodospirillales bacterium]|nr:hypothetical protein [Rhodospirillales bacterium]
MSGFNQTNTIIANHKKGEQIKTVIKKGLWLLKASAFLLPANASWAGQASEMDARVHANNNGTYAI